MKYIFKVLYGLDVFVASWFPKSRRDETISSMLGSDYPNSIFERFVDWGAKKFFKKDNHCENAAESFEEIDKIVNN